tara:strand:- start:3340 stop:4131 length:792 start_codon:yes stop_codon:yes gene_type:complete
MTHLDEISHKIGDGMYMNMMDKIKRVHENLVNVKIVDDDEEQRLQANIQYLRDDIRETIKQMHEEYDNMNKYYKRITDCKPIQSITSRIKREAIEYWCHKNINPASVRDNQQCIDSASYNWCHTDLIGSYDGKINSWTWENLIEYGLWTIVIRIGNECEISIAKKGFIHIDELSLSTLQKFPEFEKQIYNEYKDIRNVAISNMRKLWESEYRTSQRMLEILELKCVSCEEQLRVLNEPVYTRDFWDVAGEILFSGTRMIDTPI